MLKMKIGDKSIGDFIIEIILALSVFILGYYVGTYKINKCKIMTPEEAFNNQTCREFYLGR